MSETRLWEWLAGVLPVGHFSRIESPDTSPGFPDVHYQIHPNTSGTLELKFARHPHAQFPFERQGLRKSQRIWIRDSLRHGGCVHIVAQVSNRIFVVPGRHHKEFNGMDVKQLQIHSFGCVLNRKNPEQAALMLRELLLEK